MINTVPTEKNGITNVIWNLCNAIGSAQLQIDVVSINKPDGGYLTAAETWGGQVWTIPGRLRHPVRYMMNLTQTIRKGQYDAVHAHGNSATLFLEMFAAKLAGCKIRIAHSHNTSCRFKLLHAVLNPVFQGLCTHRLACSEAAGRWLFGQRQFQVIRNGVDTARFRYDANARQVIRRKYSIAPEKYLIGHVGLFNGIKNQAFLLDALRLLPEDYLLMLVGEGPEMEAVRCRARELELEDRAIFTGAVENPEAYYSAFDVMTLPSLFEGLPLTLVEAQVNGLKCLVSDRITREVDLTGNVIFLPIDKGLGDWLDVLPLRDSGREELSAQAQKDICLKGFDISTEAKKLRTYYCAALHGE